MRMCVWISVFAKNNGKWHSIPGRVEVDSAAVALVVVADSLET